MVTGDTRRTPSVAPTTAVAEQRDTSAAVAQTDALLRQLGLQDLIPEVEALVRSGATPQQIENDGEVAAIYMGGGRHA